MKDKIEKASNRDKSGNSIAGLVSNVGKIVANAKDIAIKANVALINNVDKNNNGKIDAEDLGFTKKNLQEAKNKGRILAAMAGQGAKAGSDVIGKAINDNKIEMDRKHLRPFFKEELFLAVTNTSSINGLHKARIPSMISIVERDKKRSNNEVCNGSIGYRSNVKNTEVLNIYEDCAHQLGLWFYPNITKTIYYKDPYQNNFYICLDEYFDYLKKARVNELEMVAQDLGAKKVQITFKERKKTIVTKDVKANVKVEKIKASGSYEKADNEYSNIEIAADLKFSGHDTPVEPKLVYFKNESDIEKLVHMRIGNSKNKIESKIYSFQCNKSSGIKEKEAVQIDAVLNQLKCGGTASISSEAQRESRTDLEYRIEF